MEADHSSLLSLAQNQLAAYGDILDASTVFIDNHHATTLFQWNHFLPQLFNNHDILTLLPLSITNNDQNSTSDNTSSDDEWISPIQLNRLRSLFQVKINNNQQQFSNIVRQKKQRALNEHRAIYFVSHLGPTVQQSIQKSLYFYHFETVTVFLIHSNEYLQHYQSKIDRNHMTYG